MTTMTVSLDFFGKREAERNEKQKEIVKISRVKRGNTSERKLPFSFFSLAKKKKMFPRIN